MAAQDDGIVAVGQEPSGEMTPHVTRAAGKDHLHRFPNRWVDFIPILVSDV
jgi:hypothetical protein